MLSAVLAIDLPSVDELPALALTGLATGSVAAALGAAMVVLLRTTRVLNLAVGALYVAGALLLHRATDAGLAVGLAAGLAVVAGAVAAGLAEVVVQRPLREAPAPTQLLATIGVALVVLGGLAVVVGRDPVAAPPVVAGGTTLGSTAVSWTQVLLVLVAVGVGVAGQVWSVRTASGLRAAAVSDDPGAAAALGIDVLRIRLVSSVVMGAVAALVGALAVPLFLLDVNAGIGTSITAFVAAVLGGRRGPLGAVVAGLVVGVVEAYLARVFSTAIAEALTAAALVVVVVAGPGARALAPAGAR